MVVRHVAMALVRICWPAGSRGDRRGGAIVAVGRSRGVCLAGDAAPRARGRFGTVGGVIAHANG